MLQNCSHYINNVGTLRTDSWCLSLHFEFKFKFKFKSLLWNGLLTTMTEIAGIVYQRCKKY